MKPSTASSSSSSSASSFLSASASDYIPPNSSAFTSADELSEVFANLQVYSSSGFSSSSLPAAPLYSDSIWAVDSLSNGGYGCCFNPGICSSSINNFLDASRFLSRPPSILEPGLESRGNSFPMSGDEFFNLGVNGILLMAKDEHGSKFLQEVMSFQGDSRIVTRVFEMVLEFTLEVMTSQYGRFVFGKLIESCNQDQLQAITFKIASDDNLFINASRDKNGSSCIKKLIRILGKTQKVFLEEIMLTLGKFFQFLMIDKTGSSVILLSLDKIFSKKNDFVYQAALEHCLTVANNEQGCVSMNKFIDEMRGPRRKQILLLISMNAAYLAKNLYGNYVLQHVLDLEDPELIRRICLVLRGRFIDLSMRKGGSHVVEKCLKYDKFMPDIVEEIMGSDRIVQVSNHSFGNYVMQTALRETLRVNRDLHGRLVMKLKEHINDLHQFGHGRHVCKLIR
ncbi:putative pumilio homolog 19 [Mangifera indica]|uniref:putative pumilio homolog 19 n=1 Tax=Mangifera indica TaxID=29780 RepID=UPI001CFC2607|nr:putative pumilio homolog 19 [Mangifera indica]